MLVEYALTPDIFDASCYSNRDLCRPLFKSIIDPLLNDGIVRNLRDGEWMNYVNDETFSLYPVAKYFLEELMKQNRLRRFPAISGKQPITFQEWCEEAIESHKKDALNGIIASEKIQKDRKFKKIGKVGSIEKLYLCDWWNKRSSSIRVSRTIEDYLEKLHLVLTQSIYLDFIDPNINPKRCNYKHFYKLLLATKRNGIQPTIRIHRKCKDKIEPNKPPEIIDNETWEKVFRDNLGKKLSEEGLEAEVFIWDEFHDRYLITDCIGINLPYGFDTTTNPNAKTTWCRLGRQDARDIETEFDPPMERHQKKHNFFIGKKNSA